MTNPDRDKYETVKLADIAARAADRPAGYADEVIGLAVQQDDTHVLLARQTYYALLNKYNPPPIVQSGRAWPAGFDGAALWATLHTATEATQAVIDAVTAGLSCGPCKDGWLLMLILTPPPLGDLPAFRAWGVDRHSEVSLKIGKEPWDYARAAAFYGW
jgi:hypothetical protein